MVRSRETVPKLPTNQGAFPNKSPHDFISIKIDNPYVRFPNIAHPTIPNDKPSVDFLDLFFNSCDTRELKYKTEEIQLCQ